MLIVRAPTRISFGGGGTDLEAYYAKYGGVVVSAAIAKYSYVVVVPDDVDPIEIVAVRCTALNGVGNSGRLLDGNIALARAALRHFGLRRGLRVQLSSEVPGGTGLGSSSSMAVALATGLGALVGADIDRIASAELAADLEIRRLGMPIGRQDQYAAAFGGLNVISFEQEGVTVEPLAIPPEAKAQLRLRLMLFFTGMSRLSSSILRSQRRRTAISSPAVMDSLHAIKEMALEMRHDLERGNMDRLGELLDLSWQRKKQLAPQISNAFIDECYWLARSAGALGGKITGAGGGGFLLLYCPPERQHKVADVLRAKGLVQIDFDFDEPGVQVLLNNTEADLASLRTGTKSSNGKSTPAVAATERGNGNGHTPEALGADGQLVRLYKS